MNEETRQHKAELLQIHKQRLHKLEIQAARSGSGTNAEITLEIEGLQRQIDELETQLGGSISPGSLQVISPRCPYPGMVPFNEHLAPFFFGRSTMIQELLMHLRHNQQLVLMEPSGAGKSSLLFGGLLPKLYAMGTPDSGRWIVRQMQPGNNPMQTLSHTIEGSSAAPANAILKLQDSHEKSDRLLLIIDQFEEIFTQAGTEMLRFTAAVQQMLEIPGWHLIITMRDDFKQDLYQTTLGNKLSKDSIREIQPLDEPGLREAIEKPALKLSVQIDKGLIERLLSDAADEPGVLPLIQETMVLLWSWRDNNKILLESYNLLCKDRKRGLVVAMVAKAEGAYGDLSNERKAIARRIFLRLVQFGVGRAHVRRRQSMQALRTQDDDPSTFENTLQHLVLQRRVART